MGCLEWTDGSANASTPTDVALRNYSCLCDRFTLVGAGMRERQAVNHSADIVIVVKGVQGGGERGGVRVQNRE